MANSINFNPVNHAQTSQSDNVTQNQQKTGSGLAGAISQAISSIRNLPFSLQVLGALSILGSATGASLGTSADSRGVFTGNITNNVGYNLDISFTSTCNVADVSGNHINADQNGDYPIPVNTTVTAKGNGCTITTVGYNNDGRYASTDADAEMRAFAVSCNTLTVGLSGTSLTGTCTGSIPTDAPSVAPTNATLNATESASTSPTPKQFSTQSKAFSTSTPKTQSPITESPITNSTQSSFATSTTGTAPTSFTTPMTGNMTVPTNTTQIPGPDTTAGITTLGIAGLFALVGVAGGLIACKVLGDDGKEIDVDLSPKGENVRDYNERLRTASKEIIQRFAAKKDSSDGAIHDLWNKLNPIYDALSKVNIVVDTNLGLDEEAQAPLRQINFGGIFAEFIHDDLVEKVGQIQVRRCEASYKPETGLQRHIKESEGSSTLVDFMVGSRRAFTDAKDASIRFIFPKRA